MSNKDKTRQEDASIEPFLREKTELEKTIRERFQHQITIMFTDIVSSTEFFEAHGDIEGRSMVQRHNDLVYPILEEYGGKVLKGLGDGLMISFDNPPAAARAAIKIQNTFLDENRGKRTAEQIWVKIAIHQGEGIVEKEDVYGDIVNTASRIASLSAKGDILVSRTYVDAIGKESDISFDYEGTRTLKGKAAPVDIYRILWKETEQKPDIRRSATPERRRPRAPEGLLFLNFSVENNNIRLMATINCDRAQTTKYEEDFPYREIKIRKLVGNMDLSLSSLDSRGRLSRAALTSLKDAARELYATLFPEGLDRFMRVDPAGSLTIQIDERLTHIPWELLHDGREFLCLKYSMGKLVSTLQRPLARRKELNRASFRMLLVSNPEGNLEASKAEGIAVQKELGQGSASSEVLVDLKAGEATCEFLRAHLKDYDFFHYAGHSYYNREEPSKSALMLSDGKFEVGELFGLAKQFPLPSLVFANACQSGRAEKWSSGERLCGPANAFLASGVRHYIGSGIDLFDRSSAAFAEEFYKNLSRAQSIGESLRLARLKSISRYGEETITWASYVLFGDPAFQYFQPSSRRSRQELSAKVFRFAVNKKVAAVLALITVLTLGLLLLLRSLSGKSAAYEDLAARGFNLIHAGRIAEAEETFRLLEGKTPLYFGGISAVRLSRGSTEKAEQMLSSGQLNPESSQGLVLMGDLALSKGNLDESEAGYHKALESPGLKTWQKASCRFGLGRIYLKQRAFEKAKEELDRALDLDPSFLEAYMSKGICLEQTGNAQSALEYYEKASRINPDDPITAALYRRSREALARKEDSERRKKIDSLVSDLIKAYREAPRSSGQKDEWSSKPLHFFFLDFEQKGQCAAREGEDIFIKDQIEHELTGSNRLHAVERTLLDRVMEELKIGSTELADPKTAVRLGKILSAQILVAGSVLRFKGRLQVSLRAIDTETTRIAASASESCAFEEDAGAMLRKLSLSLGERIRSAYPVRGSVVEAKEGEVTLDIGRSVGIEPGMKLHVAEKGLKGVELTVKDVEDSSCTALPAGPQNVIQTGWRVQEG